MKHSSVAGILIALIFSLFISCQSYSQHTTQLEHTEVQRIIDTCLSAFRIHYIYPEVADKMARYIQKRLADGEYNNLSALEELTGQIKTDLRQISNDRHIWVDIMENLPVTETASKEKIINEKKQNNFGFVKLEIFPGNIGYIRLDGFNDLQYARDTAIHAMGMLANSRAIILDLRENHGGHENMVHFIASYFFEEKTQLNSLYFREADSLVEGWTDPAVPGLKLIRQRLYLLTSQNTASGAESFAYTMQNYHRATIVGERTRGAAHWTESFQFPDLGIFLEIPVARPINPITQKGWEGDGVIPDIEVNSEAALDKAHKLALEQL